MDELPLYLQNGLKCKLDRLCNKYGVIDNPMVYIAGTWCVSITSEGRTYFEDKEKAMKKDAEDSIKYTTTYNYHYNNNGGNFVAGSLNHSSLSIDNSILSLEKEIGIRGGDDVGELKSILNEIKELMENVKKSRYFPQNNSLFSKLSKHLEKHSWFYEKIVDLVGKAVLNML